MKNPIVQGYSRHQAITTKVKCHKPGPSIHTYVLLSNDIFDTPVHPILDAFTTVILLLDFR
jgi:hypothetical protein